MLGWLATVGVLLGLGMGDAQAAPEPPHAVREVRVCDDDAEWPPYVFRVPDAHGGVEVRGRSVDLLRLLLGRLGWTMRLELLPWSRCLAEVAGGRAHMTLGATLTPERQRDYWTTSEVYRTQQYYVWSAHHHPKGLAITQAQDFAHWRVGGVHGFVYPYLKAVGVAPGSMAASHFNLVEMLHANRLDTVLMADSLLRSQRNREGQYFWDDPRLGKAPVPGGHMNAYHLLISKRWAPGQELLQGLESELKRMRDRGELAVLMDGRHRED